MGFIGGRMMASLLVMTSLSFMTSQSFMYERAADYKAKVRVYAESNAFDYWMQHSSNHDYDGFIAFLRSMFKEVNEIYKSLHKNDVYIEFQIEYLHVIENVLTTNNNKVTANDAIKQFYNRIKPTYYGNNYDMALLFTGAELTGHAGGLASIGSACSDKAVGVVEFRGIYYDAVNTAHVLGHILGSHHDGEDGNLCTANSGEVMNPSSGPTNANKYFFSSCSANYMSKMINKLNDGNNNCMKTWEYSDNLKAPRLGRILSPDETCKRVLGANAFALRSQLKDVCNFVGCATPSSLTISYQATPQGIDCGYRKLCLKGKCVGSLGGNYSVSDTCPLGEQTQHFPSGKLCTSMTTEDCADDDKKAQCCETCADK